MLQWVKKKKNGKIPSTNRLDLDRGNLANVIKLLTKYQVINDILLSSCLGITKIRNDSDHPPVTYEKRIKRHERLCISLHTTLDLLKDMMEEKKQKKL